MQTITPATAPRGICMAYVHGLRATAERLRHEATALYLSERDRARLENEARAAMASATRWEMAARRRKMEA